MQHILPPYPMAFRVKRRPSPLNHSGAPRPKYVAYPMRGLRDSPLIDPWELDPIRVKAVEEICSKQQNEKS